jgi:uncharacterized repeat protein (TIGR03803 family)
MTVGIAIVAGLFILLVTANEAQAQTFRVLHTFTGGPDGALPVGGLTMDRAGNLYGATSAGGNTGSNCQYGRAANGCGIVFRITHGGSGWVLSPIYTFNGYTDGLFPSARVIFGPDGALYGVTFAGGEANCNSGSGIYCGTVFRVTPPATVCKSFICPWQKSILFSFNGTDGAQPMSEVVFDQAGNLYGTTYYGGGNGGDICIYEGDGCGTVYELTPSNGTWTETVLHAFSTSASDGQNPYANLIFDSAGNLYSATVAGGSSGLGTVFQLSPTGSGWTENLLYSFDTNSNGIEPAGGLLLAAGNLIGTTSTGGTGDGGTVFELTPGQGGWTFNLMYSLSGQEYYGPEASLTMDAAGNLYGTTVSGGAYGYGSAFKLTPSNRGWTYTSLHDFTGGSDGGYVASNLIMDANGNLYGVASDGASDSCFDGCGVVFEITP